MLQNRSREWLEGAIAALESFRRSGIDTTDRLDLYRAQLESLPPSQPDPLRLAAEASLVAFEKMLEFEAADEKYCLGDFIGDGTDTVSLLRQFKSLRDEAIPILRAALEQKP